EVDRWRFLRAWWAAGHSLRVTACSSYGEASNSLCRTTSGEDLDLLRQVVDGRELVGLDGRAYRTTSVRVSTWLADLRVSVERAPLDVAPTTPEAIAAALLAD